LYRPCENANEFYLGYYRVVREIGEIEGQQKPAICGLLVPSDGRDILLKLPKVPLAVL